MLPAVDKSAVMNMSGRNDAPFQTPTPVRPTLVDARRLSLQVHHHKHCFPKHRFAYLLFRSRQDAAAALYVLPNIRFHGVSLNVAPARPLDVELLLRHRFVASGQAKTHLLDCMSPSAMFTP